MYILSCISTQFLQTMTQSSSKENRISCLHKSLTIRYNESMRLHPHFNISIYPTHMFIHGHMLATRFFIFTSFYYLCGLCCISGTSLVRWVELSYLKNWCEGIQLVFQTVSYSKEKCFLFSLFNQMINRTTVCFCFKCC